MKVSQAITQLDSLKPNAYTEQDKLDWLNRIDQKIMDEIISTHCVASPVSKVTYTTANKTTTDLLVPDGYAELYIHYMSAQIDYYNGEFNRYNNTMAMFNEAYRVFDNYYNRTHMPYGTQASYFRGKKDYPEFVEPEPNEE